jgi:hypothetical protein
MLDIGNGGFLDFHEAAGKSFPTDMLEMRRSQRTRDFQMSKAISADTRASSTVGNGEWLSWRLEPSSDEAPAVSVVRIFETTGQAR